MGSFWDTPRSPINRQAYGGMSYARTRRDIMINRFIRESDGLIEQIEKLKNKGSCSINEEIRIINRIMKIGQLAKKLKEID